MPTVAAFTANTDLPEIEMKIITDDQNIGLIQTIVQDSLLNGRAAVVHVRRRQKTAQVIARYLAFRR